MARTDTAAHLERERGILSQRDRGYLLGVADIDPGTPHERNVRREIRQRIENSLLDFSLLIEYLEERDREQVFNLEGYRDVDAGPDGVDAIPDAPVDAIGDAILFLFLGATDNNPRAVERNNGHHFPAFETALTHGLTRGYWERDYILDDLDLDIDSRPAGSTGPSLTEAAMQFAEGDLSEQAYIGRVRDILRSENSDE